MGLTGQPGRVSVGLGSVGGNGAACWGLEGGTGLGFLLGSQGMAVRGLEWHGFQDSSGVEVKGRSGWAWRKHGSKG